MRHRCVTMCHRLVTNGNYFTGFSPQGNSFTWFIHMVPIHNTTCSTFNLHGFLSKEQPKNKQGTRRTALIQSWSSHSIHVFIITWSHNYSIINSYKPKFSLIRRALVCSPNTANNTLRFLCAKFKPCAFVFLINQANTSNSSSQALFSLINQIFKQGQHDSSSCSPFCISSSLC